MPDTEPIKIYKTIVLIGMMGSGKSYLGKKLAEKLEVDFFDSDIEIENEIGMPIVDIFDIQGEEYFREFEYRTIKGILSKKPSVLAAGGGAFIYDKTRELIKQKGISIWLETDIDMILERLQYDKTRPLLQDADKKQKLLELMEKRNPIYKTADIKIKTKNNTKIFNSILKALTKN